MDAAPAMLPSLLSRALLHSRSSHARTPTPCAAPILNLDTTWIARNFFPEFKSLPNGRETPLGSQRSATPSVNPSVSPYRGPPSNDQYSGYEQSFAAELNHVRTNPKYGADLLANALPITYLDAANHDKKVVVTPTSAITDIQVRHHDVEEKQVQIAALPKRYQADLAAYVAYPPPGVRPSTSEMKLHKANEPPAPAVAAPGKGPVGRRPSKQLDAPPSLPDTPWWAVPFETQLKAKYNDVQKVMESHILDQHTTVQRIETAIAMTDGAKQKFRSLRGVHAVTNLRGLSLYCRESCHAPPTHIKADAAVACRYGSSIGRVQRCVVSGVHHETEALALLLADPASCDAVMSPDFTVVGTGWQPTPGTGATLVLYFAAAFQETCGVLRREHMSLHGTRRDLMSPGNRRHDDAMLQVTLRDPRVQVISPQFQPMLCEAETEVVLECDDDIDIHCCLSSSVAVYSTEDVYWHREGRVCRIRVRCPTVGTHSLQLFTSSMGEALVPLGAIALRCVAAWKESLQHAFRFPALFVAFHDRRCQLLSPLENPLRVNETYTFTIFVPTFNHMKTAERCVATELEGLSRRIRTNETHLAEARLDFQAHSATHKFQVAERKGVLRTLQESLPPQFRQPTETPRGSIRPPSGDRRRSFLPSTSITTPSKSIKKIPPKEMEKIIEIQNAIAENLAAVAALRMVLHAKERHVRTLEEEAVQIAMRHDRLLKDHEALLMNESRVTILNVELLPSGHRRQIVPCVNDDFTAYSYQWKVRKGPNVSLYVDGACMTSWNIV